MDPPTFDREAVQWERSGGGELVAGVDEVGRGALAGPVVAAAVVFSPHTEPVAGLKDSKQLTSNQREHLSGEIKHHACCWAVGAASNREIDRRNILRATALAMRRALDRLATQPALVLIDGSPLPELRVVHEAIVGGDASSQSIAAASVLAKCARDRVMTLLADRYPGFQWDSNKGYGTEEHLAAIRRFGLTPHHRATFAQIGQHELFEAGRNIMEVNG